MDTNPQQIEPTAICCPHCKWDGNGKLDFPPGDDGIKILTVGPLCSMIFCGPCWAVAKAAVYDDVARMFSVQVAREVANNNELRRMLGLPNGR